MKHEISRVRHDVKKRSLTVRTVERITPNMLRVLFEGVELDGFVSLSPDDHIKLFFPVAGDELEMRDYTPRHYDAAAGTLAIEFALHAPEGAGPATSWALSAKPGDVLQIGGPRGSMVVPPDFDWWLLVGDETALPAIGRRLEEMNPNIPVTTLVAVTGPAEEQTFKTSAAHTARWVHRPADRADDPAPLLAALKEFRPEAGDGFIWIAAEAKVAQAAKAFVAETLRHEPAWTKSSGYWTTGPAE